MTMNLFRKQTNHPAKSEQSVETPLNHSLSFVAFAKSSVRFSIILAVLVSITGCGSSYRCWTVWRHMGHDWHGRRVVPVTEWRSGGIRWQRLRCGHWQ